MPVVATVPPAVLVIPLAAVSVAFPPRVVTAACRARAPAATLSVTSPASVVTTSATVRFWVCAVTEIGWPLPAATAPTVWASWPAPVPAWATVPIASALASA